MSEIINDLPLITKLIIILVGLVTAVFIAMNIYRIAASSDDSQKEENRKRINVGG